MSTKNIKNREIEIPEGVELKLGGRLIEINGPKGKISKEFSYPKVKIELNGKKVVISSEASTKESSAVVGTYTAHLKNMIKGVTDGFVYKLKIVFSHFPMTVKQEGDRIEIHNFLGEKAPRIAKVVGDVKLNLGKDEVVIEGINKESVSQTAANIESATKVKRRDVRVFQDGIYITQKSK